MPGRVVAVTGASPDNLWDAVDAESDHGAHGIFGDRARKRSPQLWATTYRGVWMPLAAAALAAAYRLAKHD